MNRLFLTSGIIFLTTVFYSCTKKQEETSMKYAKDHHSFSNPNEAIIKHLNLNMRINFDAKVITGKAVYDIENNNAEQIIFDAKQLVISKITLDDDEKETTFELGEEIEFLGQPLVVKITPQTKKVSIYYQTTPKSEALLWLNPQQTAGKKYPFVFTQGQAILTRTWIPIQDSPGIRITYSARVELPQDLMAIMSAQNPQEKNNFGVYNFKMEQAIPPYLIALAAGNLSFGKIGERTGVYCEPELLDKCVYEFEDMEKMLVAAEKLYGPYRWERYDVVVLPPSFPFGGMENPRLTFATPTIIAGDKSLTSLVAHEMAHSWSGNLVTNATWDDFWLNEGFTNYFERRIMEALYGKDYADMLALLGREDLDFALQEFESAPDDTKLKLNLKGRNPDDGMSDIAYEKGSLLLRHLEELAGREKFDRFLQQYFNEYAFKTITTEEFVKYLEDNLLKPNNLTSNYQEWIYEKGLPKNAPLIKSEQFVKVQTEIDKWKSGTSPEALITEGWNTHQWIYFLRNLPDDVLNNKNMEQLDEAFAFTNTGNSEIACVWYERAVKKNYVKAYLPMQEFLINVGRRKFLVPVYKALIDVGLKDLARGIYTKAKPNYHSVSVNTIDDMMK